MKCCCLVTTLCPTLCSCSIAGFPVFHISWSLLKLMSIESMMPSNHPILCRPLLLLPLIFPSIFSNELALHLRQPKYQSFSISPSNEYSGLISFRIVWFDVFTAQGTLKSLLQHHNLKASILSCLAFFMVLLSHEILQMVFTLKLEKGFLQLLVMILDCPDLKSK